jgi:hypothetical protein
MNELQFTAPLKIEAAASGKRPKISILAYSGRVMPVGSHGDVVIDLAGLELPTSLTLLADHDNSINAVIGSGSPAVASGNLTVVGSVADSEAGNKVVQLARDGVALQASVGAEPIEAPTFVKAGESIHVNGRTIKADRPFKLFSKTRLREVTITPNGADHNTAVQISAKRRSDEMTTATPTADEIRAEQRERLKTIEATTAGQWGANQSRVDAIKAKTIGGEMEVEEMKSELLGIMRASRPTAPNVSPGQSGVADLDAIQAKLMIRAGMADLAEETYGARACHAADQIRGGSLVEIAARFLEMEHQTPSRNQNEMIKAAFSTMPLETAFGAVVNKVLESVYRESRASWRAFCSIRSARNFHSHTGVRPSFVGALEQIGPDGEIKHGTLSEATFPWSIGTYAKQLSVTRQDIINDDLSFLDETAPLMARIASRKLSDLVCTTLLGAGTFFSSSNGNKLTAALDSTSFGAALASMRTQRDAEGNDLDINPAVLLVAPELEDAAKKILESQNVAYIAGTDQTATEERATGNPHRNAVRLEVEPRLSNTGKFATTDAADWYLFGSPADAPMIVGFLDGQQTPTVEFFGIDHDVNTLGVAWRVYQDFGAALGDYRAAFMSDVA